MGQERVISSCQWRFRSEANVTGVITPTGCGEGGWVWGGGAFSSSSSVFFQLWLLSTQGIYWKGEVKMPELSLQSHIT